MLAHGRECVECERSARRSAGAALVSLPGAGGRADAGGARAGQTYRQAAERARLRLPGGERSRHGQLAADWVEVFAPVVFAAHSPDRWPCKARWWSIISTSGCAAAMSRRAATTPGMCYARWPMSMAVGCSGACKRHGPKSTLYVTIDSSLQSCVDLSMRATSRRTRQTRSLIEQLFGRPVSRLRRGRCRRLSHIRPK